MKIKLKNPPISDAIELRGLVTADGNLAVGAEIVEAAGDRNIWIVGGGDLAGQFYDADLLDEVIVQMGSVTLGKGKPLFPRRITSPPLRLLSVRQVGTGFAELHYQVPRGQTGNAA